ncbi:MAG TPA: succinate dehydrogenase cytochrome b subunit [Arachidicoccus soli]|uniref:Succinate dehydrogenase n=1 Tax=Arachidicoccus soli TaxID=2341117 RepID=A0A386HMC0_9BACT|nr:succinate dehydrogenase cytochrome b subunit [Arachidicoccus soli]AYD46641.1 succinate dehydrogenase [Arachidicoccus soli]HEU0226258.1 succinate dehydrogenase cytochrome b subunit [Arachidicoccus soli]
MSFKQVFNSAVGRKITMGLTGLFLVLFLIVHVGLNACIWANDGGVMFNHAAHFMGANWFPRVLEIGLFVFLIIHIVQGLMLEMSNRSKRGIGYQKTYGNRGSKWYSRSMGLLGTLVLLFLILHLSNFWFPNRAHQGFLLGPEIDLYAKMQDTFSVGWVVIAYLIGCLALAYHLLHGFQSAFRSLGVHNNRYNKLLTCIGTAFSIIVPLAFAMMPISFYFGWL